jgi:hypothetical protein
MRDDRGRDYGQRRVLVSRGSNRAAEGPAALDDELHCWHVEWVGGEDVLQKYIVLSTLCTVI